MRETSVRRLAAAIAFLAAGAAQAFQVPQEKGRFDDLIVHDKTESIGVATTGVESLAATDPTRAGWDAFRRANGTEWQVYLDRRSGAPLLVQGRGIRWASAGAANADGLAAAARVFLGGNRSLFLADDTELVLNRDASTTLAADAWQIVFDRVVAGVPVAGERYVFLVGHGNLVAFGATRWSKIDVGPLPDLTASEATDRMQAYMRLGAHDVVTVVERPALQIIPLPGEQVVALDEAPAPYTGAMGGGYRSALVWRVGIKIEGQPGTWVAFVDAHSGEVRAFFDDNDYAQVKGGVYPVSNDHIGPEGTEQAGYPMPYADFTIDGSTQFSSGMGIYACSAGQSVSTALNGQYIRVLDNCGAVAASATCDTSIDLGATAVGTDCSVPPGASPGDTHAARTSFYHLNRIAEHARTWLPNRTWLFQQLADNVNLNQVCNAYWGGGSVNFFKSGGGCANTGEIAGMFLHEWGHGLDQNDGGGFDNPSEAYADVTAMMSLHVSCIGRGFRGSTCGGYGDTCLSCTGVRDMDWAQHSSGTPATPTGFTTGFCPGGSGPCGREVHCEAYVPGEAMWDLAVRDLPVSGLDQATSWQLADEIWYRSRNGSGGNSFNCAPPNSDGCSAISWFQKLRFADDDDGNLGNGTPHAAAIFAAFNRHRIACGLVSDTTNQNHTSCPALAAPVLSGSIGSASAALSWTPVANATGYSVLRNDASCAAGSTIIASPAGTSFTDTGLVNGFGEYYRVQAKTVNPSCDSPVSNCLAITPQPFAGAVKLDAGSYNCTATITINVIDGNVPGGPTVNVNIASTTEPAGETVTLSSIGSSTYAGTIAVTTAPAAADGLLSITTGDLITASYTDADDGQGGTNLPRQTTALADCTGPAITKVEATRVSFDSARITWKTDEPSTSVLKYGTAAPPVATINVATPTYDHAVDVSGLTECTSYVFSAGSTDAVGNVTTDNASGAYYGFTTGKNSALDFASTDTPLPIPDGNAAGVISTINVPNAKTILDVNVTLTIAHTNDSDLTIELLAPDGTEIPLIVQRGGSGDNFNGTVLDDEATSSISAGTAPFSSTYRPETPLSVVDGMSSAGAWKLKVWDNFGGETGTITSWKLTITVPPTPCGPRAAYQSSAIVADTCAGGGAGSGNGFWDAGEQVQFKVNLANVGTVKLTGVTATITSPAPGVVMVDGNAAFPGLGIGISADSIAPHFTVQLPTNLVCGATVPFNITITANEGTWNGSFTVPVGHPLGATGTVLSEGFSAGIPATWTVVNGGNGGGVAQSWTTANPGIRAFTAPLQAPVAIVDSDAAGVGATQDEELITPALDLTASPIVTLQFDQFFRWYAGGQDEIADVDVRSSATGGTWVNVFRQQGGGSANPDHRTVDISAQAGRASSVQVRFHDYNGSSEWWWELDNVRIDTGAYVACDMPVCGAAQPNVARPVADGVFGTPMRASRANAAGSQVALTWDTSTCTSADHHVLYGDLANVASVVPTGAFCDLGATGSATWSSVPAGSLWFVIAGDDNATTEGTWGTDGIGGQRGGATASGFCGATSRNNAATCP